MPRSSSRLSCTNRTVNILGSALCLDETTLIAVPAFIAYAKATEQCRSVSVSTEFIHVK